MFPKLNLHFLQTLLRLFNTLRFWDQIMHWVIENSVLLTHLMICLGGLLAVVFSPKETVD